MKKLSLSQNKTTLVDNEDFEYLNQFKWSFSKGYAKRTNKERKYISLHRVIMGVSDPKIFIDHINGNPLDNRRSNLRVCTNSENQKNKKASGTSKYLGVSLHTTKNKYLNKKGELKEYPCSKWLVHIKHNGKYIHGGLFESETDAAIKYNELATKYHGDFAKLNII